MLLIYNAILMNYHEKDKCFLLAVISLSIRTIQQLFQDIRLCFSYTPASCQSKLILLEIKQIEGL